MFAAYIMCVHVFVAVGASFPRIKFAVVGSGGSEDRQSVKRVWITSHPEQDACFATTGLA
jgi:hypothetical protein